VTRDRARAAVQWLSGESIEKEAAHLLHLTGLEEDGAALADDAAVERVFRVLAHVGAVAGRPIVLCVDQVDNLDLDKVKALSAFLQVLLGRCGKFPWQDARPGARRKGPLDDERDQGEYDS